MASTSCTNGTAVAVSTMVSTVPAVVAATTSLSLTKVAASLRITSASTSEGRVAASAWVALITTSRSGSTCCMVGVVSSVCASEAASSAATPAAISLGRSTPTLPTPTPASISNQSIFCACCLMASLTLESIIASVKTPSSEEYAAAFQENKFNQRLALDLFLSRFIFCVNRLIYSPARPHQVWRFLDQTCLLLSLQCLNTSGHSRTEPTLISC